MIKYSKHIVESSQFGISRIIKMIGINRVKYYDWLNRLNLPNHHNGHQPKQHWLTPQEKQSIIDYARNHISSHEYYTKDGYRRITYNAIDANKFACGSTTVYRVLSKDSFKLLIFINLHYLKIYE